MSDSAFEAENEADVAKLAERDDLVALSNQWVAEVSRLRYSYHFTWMGRPVIQFPQDMIAGQEIVWSVKPDLIVETGIGRGGSLIYYASLLQLLGGNGRVLGIDIDIREHNRVEIEKHPMFERIDMIQGSSTDPRIAAQARAAAETVGAVLVVLDSNHTHEHVFEELKLYAPLVTKGSYLIVYDTIIEDLPEDYFPDRPWGPGNNPRTAVNAYLKTTDRFEVDHLIDAKLQITVGRGGYLKCVK